MKYLSPIAMHEYATVSLNLLSLNLLNSFIGISHQQNLTTFLFLYSQKRYVPFRATHV